MMNISVHTRQLGWAALGVIAACHPTNLLAKSSEICDPVLVANVEYGTLNNNSRLAYLSTITSENFQERKKSAGGSLSYEGVDLGASYEEFSKNRSVLFEKFQYTATKEVAVSTLRSVVPEPARKDWLDCVKKQATQSYGLHVWVEREGADGADVHIVWNPTPPPAAAKVGNQTIIGGTVPGLPRGKWLPSGMVLQANGSATALIVRDGNKEIRGTLTVSGISESFYSPPVLPPRHSIGVMINGAATISRSVKEQFQFALAHHQCVNTQYWRQFPLCSSDVSRQFTGIASYSTSPVSPLNAQFPGGLPDYQCFQAISANIAPGPSKNCVIVNVLYNECKAGGFVPDLRNRACVRGTRGGGTPIAIELSGTYDETLPLPQFSNSSVFGTSKRWSYPDANIPAGAKNISFSHLATITDLVDGHQILLDDDNKARGGFRMIVDDDGKSITVIREDGKVDQPISENLGFAAPTE